MNRPFEIHGIVVPVITPLLPSDEVDREGLRHLLRFLLAARVHGLWVLGATGQFDTLTDQQRDIVIEVAVDEAQGRVPVLAGCIETGPARSVERARRAQDLGADGVFATAPGFAPVTQIEILTHFRRIREATPLPVVAYNAVYATQTPMAIPTVRTLAEEGSLAGLKDSADFGDLSQMLVELADLDDFPILSGIQFLADAALLMGARGCIPPLANVVPGWFVDLYDAAQAGDWSRAAQIQNRITALQRMVREWAPGSSVFGEFLGAAKTALRLMGIIDHAIPGDPFPLPTDAQVAAVRGHLSRFELV